MQDIAPIEIEATYKSPHVRFDPDKGNFKIEGKSILVNVEEFYQPLLDWMDKFIENPTSQRVEFTFDVEYYNIASTKRFLFFLYRLKELKSKGVEVVVNWLYADQDKYVLETGEDLSQMLDIPFNFVGYKKLHSKNL
jgi:hypothetical protein